MSYTYSSSTQGTESKNVIKEQLRLFDVDGEPMSALAVPQSETPLLIDKRTTRQRLVALLAGELDFHGHDTSYASHDLHAFAAKFPPQLPRAFICTLSKPGDVVLDPMMGSGTAVVEALLQGRRGVGLDIDPLALRLTRVKTLPLNVDELRNVGYSVLTHAHQLLSVKGDSDEIEQALNDRFDERTKEFVDYWFLPATQRELMALALPIEAVADAAVRRFLELTFSSIIVTKSGGVSMARDLAHSRPHLDITKVPKNAIEQFAMRLRKNLASMAQLTQFNSIGIFATPIAGDARSIPLADNTVDLIVTSPPYANAIDYMRAHKFSLVWFGETVTQLSKLRSTYIGSERTDKTQLITDRLPSRAEEIIVRLQEVDQSKAAILRKYFLEMRNVIFEMHRVLRPDAAAIIVVGTSTMRDMDVETHYCLADIGAELGFDVVGVAKRNLDRNRRMMPARFGKKSDSMIEQRMHDEYVIGLLKPDDDYGHNDR
jgi:DNA modification methylase